MICDSIYIFEQGLDIYKYIHLLKLKEWTVTIFAFHCMQIL